MHRLLKSSFILYAFLALTACAVFDVPVAKSFEERVLAGYGSVAATADMTSALLDAKKISAADARNAHTQLTTLKEGIDVAVAIRASGDFASADARLSATIAALNVLRTYLGSRGAT